MSDPNKEFRDQQQKRPPQEQERQPGREHRMEPTPVYIRDDYRGSGKLEGKVALVTGGDSGIGRAVAVHFAREGADLALVYLEEDSDAQETRQLVLAEGRQCLLFRGDVGDEQACRDAVAATVDQFGHLDILVNNAGEQHPRSHFRDCSAAQMEKTFRTNVFSCFYCAWAALEHLPHGGSIINTTSVTAYRGSDHLIDYSATKGAIVSFTRSLAKDLAASGIRVNAVAPGPVWAPLIPASFDASRVESFGEKTLFDRAGQPAEVAPCYVLLASQDGSFMTGQVLHPNGGDFMTT